ncbi:MAG: MoxR family ATPase [Pseudomonadota bacterium]
MSETTASETETARGDDMPTSPDDVRALLSGRGYLADEAIATTVFLGLKLGRPLLLEGEAGVGKTEIARVLAASLGRELVRLQCYEGLDLASAAYDWNYTRQLLHIRAAEAAGEAQSSQAIEADLYSKNYLLPRPLLHALELSNDGTPPVLLIDELDRADEPFEAFLLEFLADYQLSIPEMGTVKAATPPITILTSNRTREVHDAVRRRCFYLWVDYPNSARELEILKLKLPNASDALSEQIVGFVQQIRAMDLYKNPGIAETINWAQALTALNAVTLDPEVVQSTLGTLLKYQDDIARVQGSEAARVLQNLKSDAQQLGS